MIEKKGEIIENGFFFFFFFFFVFLNIIKITWRSRHLERVI